MPQYVLLLHNDGEAWKKLSPEEMQKKVEKYIAWRNKPFVVGGAGLVRDSGLLIYVRTHYANVFGEVVKYSWQPTPKR